MKIKRMISVICAVSMSISAFAGLSVQAAESVTWETILEDNFDNGISKVTDEGAVAGGQIANVDNTLEFGNSYETFHISFDDKKSYSSSDANIFKITFDTKVKSLSRLGIGLGDTVRNNGAYWNFSAIIAGTTSSAQGKLAMGSAWEDPIKLYALEDSDGNTKEVADETWYTVEAYLEMPSKTMTTKAWLKNDPSVVYTKRITAPAYGSFNIGGSNGTSVNSVRLFSRGISYLDNLKVERMVFPSDSELLFWADFDAVGSYPADEDLPVTKSFALDGTNMFLALDSSWGSAGYKLNQAISQSSTCKIETCFDIKFSGNSRNGVGIGGDNRANGSFWIIAYTNQGLQIGSVENNEKGKRVLLKDSEGNTLTPDTSKWYRVESKIELPSKKMETKLYARDEENPTVYSAAGDMFAKGNYIVGGMDSGVDITKLRLFTGSTPMSVDNIVVEKTVPPFNAISAEFNGTGIDVTFNYEISDGSAIMLNGRGTTGTLSGDKKTYTIPASDLVTGTYAVTIPTGLEADNGMTIAEENVFLVEVKDSMTLGYHPFNYGKDNGQELNAAGWGDSWASILQENENYYLHATKGQNGNGAWNGWSLLAAGDTTSNIDAYWQDGLSPKMMSIEFDIKSCGIPTNVERVIISKRHQHNNGLEILGMNASSVNMGEPEPSRAFNGITNLEVGEWYHYKYILDISNKKAKAVLSIGDVEYAKDWTNVSGENVGYWKETLATPFDTLAFQLAGGDIDLDNITFRKYYEPPKVDSESIVFKSGGKIQSDPDILSTCTDTVEIDFGTIMDESTLNNSTVYIIRKESGEKLSASGELSGSKYILTINDTSLQARTTYELHITTGVKNPAGDSIGDAEYVREFTTNAGSIKATLTGVDLDGTPVTTFSELRELAGKTININVNYMNTTGVESEYNIIVANYSNGALAGAKIISVNKSSNEVSANDKIEYVVPDMSQITRTSIFLWNNMNELRALSLPIEF